MGERVEQSLDVGNVQTSVKPSGKEVKKRSVEAKVGRLKYHEVVTKKILGQNERILDELRWIRHRLRALGESDIDVPMLQRWAVRDQVDLLILERVRVAGDPGVFPKDVAKALNELGDYRLKHYHVSRRIVRMNKRFHLEVGECVFEKRGHRWALTRFAFDVYGATDLEDAEVDDPEVARSIPISNSGEENAKEEF